MSVFQDKVIFITGAASGIGREFARQVAPKRAIIAGFDLNQEGLESLGDELKGTRYAWHVGDVTKPETLQEAVEKFEAELGPIHMLVACAGIGRPSSFKDGSVSNFEPTIMINLIGVANSIHAVVPGMIERKAGHLVALSSVASFRGMPGMSAYCASKAGVNAMMESYRVELKPHGIVCTTVCPAWIRTPMTEAVELDLPKMLEPEFAVALIVQAVEKKKPFIAFPGNLVRRVRFLNMLPWGTSDGLIAREFAKLERLRKPTAEDKTESV